MATYIAFNHPNGSRGVARVYVNKDGTDDLQLMHNDDGSVASFTPEDAAVYVEAKNKRWIEEAEQAAVKLSR